MITRAIFMSVLTSSVFFLCTSCSGQKPWLIPKILPDNTVIMKPLIIEYPWLYYSTEYFNWPNTNEGREVLQTWWENAGRNMGTTRYPFDMKSKPGLTLMTLKLNKGLSISFGAGGDTIIAYPERRIRKCNKYDKMLYAYMSKVCKTQKPLSEKEGRRRSLEFVPKELLQRDGPDRFLPKKKHEDGDYD